LWFQIGIFFLLSSLRTSSGDRMESRVSRKPSPFLTISFFHIVSFFPSSTKITATLRSGSLEEEDLSSPFLTYPYYPYDFHPSLFFSSTLTSYFSSQMSLVVLCKSVDLWSDRVILSTSVIVMSVCCSTSAKKDGRLLSPSSRPAGEGD